MVREVQKRSNTLKTIDLFVRAISLLRSSMTKFELS